MDDADDIQPSTSPKCTIPIEITVEITEDPINSGRDAIVVIGKIGAIEVQDMVFEVDRNISKNDLQEIVDDLTSNVAFTVGERVKTRLFSTPVVVFDDVGFTKPDSSDIKTSDIYNEATNSVHRRQSPTS